MSSEKMTTRVREVRVAAQRRQIEVATLAGLSQARLSLIENGWQRARPDELARVAEVLGCSPRDLLEPGELFPGGPRA